MLLPAAATTYLLVSLLILAPRKPGYSHIRHTISELGEIGARDSRLVALGAFLPIGLLLLLAAYLLRPASPPSAVLALCIAVGYLGAAVFPCDPGSPASGSARQGMHNLAGGAEYVGGGGALITLAASFGDTFRAAGFVVLGSAIALTVMPTSPVRGLLQRAAELCLFGGLTMAAWR